ncbi:MAG: PrsW family intramembrane metalloprotease [Halodesulfurarchaeum sp.]
MTDQDPVQAFHDDRDLYGIATWEPRTPLDAAAIGLHALLRLGIQVLVVVVALGIFVSQIAIGGFALLRDPALGALTGLSMLPAFALAGYVWLEDPTLKQPLSTLVVTFLLGVLLAGFAAMTNTALEPAFRTIPVIGVGLFFFVVVAPAEEFVKWLAIRLYGYERADFQAVIDGAVLGAVAGLGFATVENALYITNVYLTTSGVGPAIGTETLGVTSVRSLAGPGHVIYSSFAGYYLGLAKFNREHAGPIVVKGLLLATLIHASYNTAVSYLPEITSFPFLAFLGFVVVFDGTFVVILYRKLSAYRNAYLEAIAKPNA